MLFYSEKDKKFYKTEEDLVEAEKKYDEAQAEIEQKAAERKKRAKEVEDAYKKSIEARNAATEMIKSADKEYYRLRNQFNKDYGNFHASFSSTDDEPDSVIECMNAIFRGWPFLR